MTQRALVAEGSSSLCRFLVSCLRRALRCPVDAVHTGQELAVAIETSPYRVLVVGDALASPLRPALERAVRAGRTVVLVGGDDSPATIRGASALARPRSGSAFDGAAFALAVSSLIAENDGAAQSASHSSIRQPVAVIAASTGGTEAVGEVLERLSPDCAPVVIVQHMPAYTEDLVVDQWAARTAACVRLADAPESLTCGVVYVARSNAHVIVEQRGAKVVLRAAERASLGGHCPSADLLFESAAKLSGETLGMVLTGMGDDGAKGLLAMRKAGATTWVEHRSTCKVYGMPRAAVQLGAAAEELPRDELARRLAKWLVAHR